MTTTPRKPKRVARVCAVCGKRTNEPTYGFASALKVAGLANWRDDKAHQSCIARLGKVKESKATGLHTLSRSLNSLFR